MISVGGVCQRAGLVDADAFAALLRFDDDPLDLIQPRSDLGMEGNRGLDGGFARGTRPGKEILKSTFSMT